MKKRNIFMTLGALASVTLPVAAVVSCGAGKKDEQIQQKNRSIGIADINSNTKIGISEGVIQPDAYTDTNLWNQAYYDANGEFINLGDNSNVLPKGDQGAEARVYEVTTRNSSNTVRFLVDKKLHTTDEEISKMINTFIENSNFGLGWLSLRNVIITSKTLYGSAPYASNENGDIIINADQMDRMPSTIASANLSGTILEKYSLQKQRGLTTFQLIGESKAETDILQDIDLIYKEVRNYRLQKLFDTFQNAYRVHEMSMWDSTFKTQVDQLVYNDVFQTELFKQISDLDQISGDWKVNDQKKALMSKTIDEKFVAATNSINDNGMKLIRAFSGMIEPHTTGSNYLHNLPNMSSYSVYKYDPKYYSDVSFMADNLSFVVTPMISLERTVFYNGAPQLYNNSFLVPYQYGMEDRKLYDDKFQLTKEAHDLIEAYGKYVYGYSTHGIEFKSRPERGDWFEVEGYSTKDFDKIRILNADGSVFSENNMDSIRSHFVTRDEMMGKSIVINNSFAYHSWIKPGIPSDAKVQLLKGDQVVSEDTYANYVNPKPV